VSERAFISKVSMGLVGADAAGETDGIGEFLLISTKA
jgi:hypothetical protein